MGEAMYDGRTDRSAFRRENWQLRTRSAQSDIIQIAAQEGLDLPLFEVSQPFTSFGSSVINKKRAQSCALILLTSPASLRSATMPITNTLPPGLEEVDVIIAGGKLTFSPSGSSMRYEIVLTYPAV